MLFVIGLAEPNLVHGQVWSNPGSGTFKWEDAANWSGGAPSIGQSETFITNAVNANAGLRFRTVTVDSATSSSDTMSINNLTLSAPGTGLQGNHNSLFLNNAGSETALQILNTFTITSGGAVNITNSILTVIAILEDDAAVSLNTGTINSGSSAIIGHSSVGQMAVSDGTWQGSIVVVGFGTSSQGTLMLAGGTSTFASSLVLGYSASTAAGTVWLTGGQLLSGTTEIGSSGGGLMTVSNGNWQAHNVDVGQLSGSQGTLSLVAGSNVVDVLNIGLNSSSTGSVWMLGGNLLVSGSGGISVGTGGIGSLVQSNGSISASSLSVAVNTGSQGTLTVAGGTLAVGQLVATNTGATIAFPSGTMTLNGANVANGQVFPIGGPGQTAVLNFAGGTNTFGNAIAIGNAIGSTGAVWLTGGQLTVTGGVSITYVGLSGVGQLTVSNGTWQPAEVDVGRPGAAGTVTVADGNVLSTGGLTVGVFAGGTGTVWLTGGLLTSGVGLGNGGGIGRMVISNGTWTASSMSVGASAGSGTLTIVGGQINLGNYTFIGAGGSSGIGTLWMTGGVITNSGTTCSVFVGFTGTGRMTVSNNTWLSDEMQVGVGGQGTLTIAGGTVRLGITSVSADFTVGLAPGGTGTVWLTGGQLILTNGPTRLGARSGPTVDGFGRMTVSNGIWRARDITIAGDAGSQGTLTIAGGSSSIYSNLTIGNSDCGPSGTMFVKGGSMFVTNAAHNAVLDVRDGELLLSGGTLTVDVLVMTNACGRFVRSGGTLSITSTNLNPDYDADGDGIANGWELAYGFSPFDNTTGVQDTDGDGLDNFVEYVLGTDPLDPHDPFRITAITRETNNIHVTWQYVPPPGNEFEHCVVEASPAVTGTWNAVSGTITLPPDFFIIATTNFVETAARQTRRRDSTA